MEVTNGDDVRGRDPIDAVPPVLLPRHLSLTSLRPCRATRDAGTGWKLRQVVRILGLEVRLNGHEI